VFSTTLTVTPSGTTTPASFSVACGSAISAEVLIESGRRHYNAVKPHASLGYRPPAPETILPPTRALLYAPFGSVPGLAANAGS
jgi:hypothetical protein